MTQKEIRQVVRETIAELRRQDVLKSSIDTALRITGKRLKAYYSGEPDAQLQEVLDRLRNDVYFRIIPLYYKDGYTIETISEKICADTSTISRNKKRLCLEIYSELN
ncbi:hypothetical protein [Ruminococcus sp.]|uniref:hypothetical protein n=1 Tax=Ruminococcus sp. TaxID=41978 RepID=UPI001B7A52A8|nr:hypothetical protein [Ruminococcus sp.]MBP5432336.1 hypothetical protein [Ruminococcus sp.]